MKVNEQIRARREQLGLTVARVAKRAGVSEQAVRYWEAGRSVPRKEALRVLQEILNFTIDWTEGKASGRPVGASALFDQSDVELLLLLCRLPPHVKGMIGELASEILSAPATGRRAFSEKVGGGPIKEFGPSGITHSNHAQKSKRTHR